jgi:glyoxylase-like metal-dependent hydrolase (beta-lactamase superfamily II)
MPGKHNVWIVDCGYADDIIQWLKLNQKSVSGIFLTHSHYDHICGLNRLKGEYPHLKVYTSSNGVKGLYSSKLNMSHYHPDVEDYVYEFEDVCELKGMDRVDLWQDTVMEVIETPGHDWSCLTYKTDRHLFTGDSYIPGLKVVSTFPKSNKIEANESLKKIIELKEKEDLIICPGHFLKKIKPIWKHHLTNE